MEVRRTPIERAFELAKSGKYRDVSEILLKLKMEGHSVDQIVGSTLKRQLVGIITEAQKAPKGQPLPLYHPCPWKIIDTGSAFKITDAGGRGPGVCLLPDRRHATGRLPQP